MTGLADALDTGLAKLGLAIEASRQERLLEYLRLLQKWNKTYNLTAIDAPERILTQHLLDSLSVLPYIAAGNLLDVGSGGGLPGIPISVARDDVNVTLIDASVKKCAFLRQVAIELHLGRVSVAHGRVETFQHVEGFSQIISRAFSDLRQFVGLTAHLLAAGGEWLAMKGTYPADELALVQGARLKRVIALHIPGLDAERHLIVLEKQ